MQAIAYYLLQVMICSVLLMGYYWLFLRNERFHRYNRFYLLSIAVLCWVIPLVRIQLQVPDEDTGDVYRLMTVVADQQTYWETTVQSASFHLGWEEIVWIVYTVVTSLLMLGLFRAILKIRLLLNKHACRKIQDVYIIMTQVQGTPFSFFKYIFWHTDIDLRSDDGQRMLEHELTHVREWHSVDKLLIQLLLVFGWINPILWLIKKELEMIHEFIADQKAVQDGDTAALASMLLTAIYPQQRTLLTHSFFFSPIKRRILMLTKNNHPRFSYFRRVVVLPIAFVIATLFAFRTESSTGHVSLSKTYTVILDAGHGGEDPGAKGADAVSEAEITLAIVKKIEALNTNPSIRFVLTRSQNEFVPLQKRVQLANEVSADLILSVHVDNLPGKSTPANDVYITKLSNHPAYAESMFIGSVLVSKLQEKGMNADLKTRTTKGIYVLDAPTMPAAIVMAGNMSSRNQVKQLESSTYQQEFAVLILEAIESYLQQKNAGIKAVVGEPLDITALKRDTIPTNKKYTKAAVLEKSNGLSPMVYLDGKKIDNVENLNNINPDEIAMVNVLKGDKAVKKYGALAKERGVIEVITKGKQVIEVIPSDPAGVKDFQKRNSQIKQVYWKHSPLRMIVALKDGTEESYDLTSEASKNRAVKKYGKLPVPAPPPPPAPPVAKEQAKPDEGYDKVFTKTQVPASFPGGFKAWQEYLTKNLDVDVPVKNGAPPGKYNVTLRFLVDEQGGISNIEAENDPGYGTAAEAINLIKKGPNWVPAKQNGKDIRYLMKQSITFFVPED
jgi:N-acetylmuramoyl-L-alanine amidase